MATALINKDTNTSLADSLLVAERYLVVATTRASGAPTAQIRVIFVLTLLHHHVLLSESLVLLIDLLLDNILVQDLVVEFKRLLVDQLVVQSFAISRLNDIALRVDTILVSLLGRCLMLTLEFLFLLHSVSVVFNESLRGRDIEFGDSTIVQLINSFIEGLWVNV